MKKNKKKMTIGIEDYIKANKKLAREEELARNGGRWMAKDRPHKNMKKYDRKRDKKNFDSYLSFFFNEDFVSSVYQTCKNRVILYLGEQIEQ